MNEFAALDTLLSGAVNSVFGELVTFEAFKPAADVNSPKIPDADRIAFTTVAIWVEQTNSMTPPARGQADSNAHSWTASQPQISIDNVDLIWRPQPGDRILRVETGEIYEIARPPRPDGMGHTVIQLTARRRAPAPVASPSLDLSEPGNSQFIPVVT